MSRTVTHSQTQTVSFDVTPMKQFKVGGQLSFGEQDAVANVYIDANQKTVAYTHNDSWAVPPGKAAVVQLRAWAVQYAMPFSTTVLIDADLSTNDRGLTHLSDIVPDPSKRTFAIAGIVKATDASAAHYVEYGAPYDPSQCGGGDLTPVKRNFVPRNKSRMLLKTDRIL